MTKKTPLSDLQKIQISNGGMAHKYLRTGKSRFRFAPPKRKGGNVRAQKRESDR
jgi:hypothetical protein